MDEGTKDSVRVLLEIEVVTGGAIKVVSIDGV